MGRLKADAHIPVARMLGLAVVLFTSTLLIQTFIPSALPFGAFEFWRAEGNVEVWVKSVWFIFAWSIGHTVLVSIFTANTPWVNRDAEGFIITGFALSLWAGVMEEILYRWLVYLTSIVVLNVLNFLLFGFIGFGLLELLHLYVLGPLANLATFGTLEAVLFKHAGGWAVGAAIIMANGFFRDGHKYQGWLGWVNSWFFGMVMFWLLFKYGLVAAITVHFFYDLFIFLIRYIDAAIERALGWV